MRVRFPLQAPHLSLMKTIFALLGIALLSACVGDGNTSPNVTDIQAKGLSYGERAEFDFFGTYLDKGLSASVPNCTGQTPAFISPIHQVLTCTVNGIGALNVEVRDGAGALIFSKSFTVPAPRAAMVTSLGNLIVELDPTNAPLSTNNFLRYVQSGYYTETIFHRVIPRFVIQGGGFNSGLVVAPGTFAPISQESRNGLSNLRGTLAMARSADPNSATSQFYLNLADNVALDYKDANNLGYAVFGKLVQGFEVMDAIGAVTTGTVNGVPDVPTTDILIKTALRIQ